MNLGLYPERVRGRAELMHRSVTGR